MFLIAKGPAAGQEAAIAAQGRDRKLALAKKISRYCHAELQVFFRDIEKIVNKIEAQEAILDLEQMVETDVPNAKKTVPYRIFAMMAVLLTDYLETIQSLQPHDSDAGSSSNGHLLETDKLITTHITNEIVYAAADIFMTLLYSDLGYPFYHRHLKPILIEKHPYLALFQKTTADSFCEEYLQAKALLLSATQPLVILEHALSLIVKVDITKQSTNRTGLLLQQYFAAEPGIPKIYHADDDYHYMPTIYVLARGKAPIENNFNSTSVDVADLEKEDSHERTAVHWAAINGHFDLLNGLLDSVTEPVTEILLYTEDFNGLTPLYYIAMSTTQSHREFFGRMWATNHNEMMEVNYNKFHRAPWTLFHAVLYKGNSNLINLIERAYLFNLMRWLKEYAQSSVVANYSVNDYIVNGKYIRDSVDNPKIVLLSLLEVVIRIDDLARFTQYHDEFVMHIDDEMHQHLLRLAYWYECSEILRFLINRPIDNTAYSHRELAEIFLKNNNVDELVRMIVLYPAMWDVNMERRAGNTSLVHIAVEHATTPDGLSCLDNILSVVKNFDIRNNHGQTPLHLAAAMGSPELIDMLLFYIPKNSDVYDALDAAGNTALAIAEQKSSFLKRQLETCIENAVVLNEEEQNDVVMLENAIHEYENIMQLLRERSKSTEVTVEKSPQLLCEEMLLPSIYHPAQFPQDDANLMEWETLFIEDIPVADILQQDKEGRSALHWTFIHGHVHLAIMLCAILKKDNQHNAIYTLKDNTGLSPMAHAVTKPTSRHARLLLSIGEGSYDESKYLRSFMTMVMVSKEWDDETKETISMLRPYLSDEHVMDLFTRAMNSQQFFNAYYLWRENRHLSQSINILSALLQRNVSSKNKAEKKLMQHLMIDHSELLSQDYNYQYPLTVAVQNGKIETAIFLLQQVAVQHKQSTPEQKALLLSDDAAREFLIACYHFKEKGKSKQDRHDQKVLPDIIKFFPTLGKNKKYYDSGPLKLSSSLGASWFGRLHDTFRPARNGASSSSSLTR